ncbi:hypothetical protein [Pseudotamlana carrageenivorans]|uniref:Uncharacterized protein n=1 Tax=Pseudotamlana carrageenivorans TaxID=2069432 RepID=A0A2I7SJU3_9FLAO|nr:hypothetical protein [Tamlana carrageenivorans]AUS06175.1 hypothetical protein C1A40_12255 [Tamlana carrageenivorans]
MKYLNYILIVIGAFIAIYAKANANQNQYVLIGGIVVLMLGIYRVAKTVPSKSENEDLDNQDHNAL